MVILGINGWPERSHDASACLIVDGQLVAYAEEERFVRIKHAFDRLPYNAVAYCLHSAHLYPDDIDVIACGWDVPALYRLHNRHFGYSQSSLNELLLPEKYFGKRKKKIPVEFVNHHLAHAASVYCGRLDEEPLPIVVIDGAGENSATSIFLGSGGRLKLINDFPIESSLGLFYESACRYLGFSHWDAGKLMGLASYGSPDDTIFFGQEKDYWLPPFYFNRSDNKSLDWEEEINRLWLGSMKKVWGEPKSISTFYDSLKGRLSFKPSLGQRERNIAATIQRELERLYSRYVKEALSLSRSESIGLAGGVTLNCSANGMIRDSGLVSNIYLHPASNDAGVALGAAVMMLDYIPANFFSTPYLGPKFSTADIRNVLITSGVSFYESADVNKEVVASLNAGKIVGYFQGRMEVGPRALGGRSILADPRKIENHAKVNHIKSRENWRPLAPSVTPLSSNKYFGFSESSPYMLKRYFVNPKEAEIIPAVIHVDGSVRPQTVNSSWHPGFFDLLDQFEQSSGVPVLLNTSFNNEREPIVCTPQDALRTFFSSELDELAIESFIVRKNGGKNE